MICWVQLESTSGHSLITVSEHESGCGQCSLVVMAIGTCGFGRSLEKEVGDNPAVMKFSSRHLCTNFPCTVCFLSICVCYD